MTNAGTPPNADDAQPRFEPARAEDLIGKHILVGLTYNDKRGQFKRYEQIHGTVVSVDVGKGICLALKGSREGEMRWLPPSTGAYAQGPKGDYRLEGTGELVISPDLIAQWTITEPDT